MLLNTMISLIQFFGGVLLGRQVGQMIAPYIVRSKTKFEAATYFLLGLAVVLPLGYAWGTTWSKLIN